MNGLVRIIGNKLKAHGVPIKFGASDAGSIPAISSEIWGSGILLDYYTTPLL